MSGNVNVACLVQGMENEELNLDPRLVLMVEMGCRPILGSLDWVFGWEVRVVDRCF